MPRERIHIVVDETGAVRTRRRIEGIGTGARSAQRSVRLLNRALGALGASFAFTELVRLVDAYQNLQNRLRTVTTSTGQLRVVTSELFDISNRTRSSFETTAEIYARTALSVKELGISQKETLQFTESLTQAIVLSGASVQESRNAAIQLSQGLASGALRGDELRSVLEQLPAVADVIAKGLGVTRGELRQLGADGKITSELIFESFAKAQQDLQEQFDKTIPTVGQSLLVLQNRFIEVSGTFGETSGLAELLSRSILVLADNLEVVARVATAAGVALGIKFGKQGIDLAIAGLNKFRAALLTNPLGVFAVILSATVGLLVAFSDKITLGGERMANLQDISVTVLDEIGRGFNFLVDQITPAFDTVIGFVENLIGEIDISLVGVLRAVASFMNFFLGLWLGAYNSIIDIYDQLPAALGQVVRTAFNRVSRTITEGVNQILPAINALRGALNLDLVEAFEAPQIEEDAGATFSRLGQSIRENFEEGLSTTTITDGLERALDNAEKRARERIRRQQEENEKIAKARAELGNAGRNVVGAPGTRQFRRVLDDLLEEFRIMRLGNREREIARGLIAVENTLRRELTNTEAGLVEQILRANQAFEGQRDMLEEIRGPQEQYNDAFLNLTLLYQEGLISSKEFNAALREQNLLFLESQQNTGFVDNFLNQLQIMKLETEDILGSIGRTIAEIYGPGGTLSQGFGDVVAEAILMHGVIDEATGKSITFTEVFRQGIHELAKDIIGQLISALVQVGVNMVLNATLGKALSTAALATTATQAAAAGSAWATPAALASLATLGTNTAAATTGIVTAITTAQTLARLGGLLPGFQEGGFTGNVSERAVAGLVHGQEFVVNAHSTRRNRVALEAGNAGAKLVPVGSAAAAASGGFNVTINNTVPGVEFDVQQVTMSEVEITARRVVREEAGVVVAGELSNPNSRVSKAVVRNTTADRRRL